MTSVLYGALIILAIIMVIFYRKCKRPFRSAFKGGFTGIISLLLVHFLGPYIGIALPLSPLNIIVSLLLGIPGVILLLILNLLI